MNTESSGPKPYTQQKRWKICGVMTTDSPLHIGNGEVTSHPKLSNTATKQLIEVAAVERDHAGKPCIPGSAIKGVLRSWAERYYSQYSDSIRRIFGDREVGTKGSSAGLAEFYPATLLPPGGNQVQQFERTLPYWRTETLTGILSHVCIGRHNGTAEEGMLFSEEFVPEGVAFEVEIFVERLGEDDIRLLLAVLEHGTNFATDPIQFGANGADGWGRVLWESQEVSQAGPLDAVFDQQSMSFTTIWTRANLASLVPPPADTRFVSISIGLQCNGAFLVNDTSRTHREEGDGLPHFFPVRRADGSAWLPASSFRGVLRQRAEFILRSLNPNATGDPNGAADINGQIEHIFGMTGRASRLRINEFRGSSVDDSMPLQDFVAIDRFTGGAAEGAKFEARYAYRPAFTTSLQLDTADLIPSELALLAAALRDVMRGDVCFGFGGSKGYGEFKGSLDAIGESWLKVQLPNLLAPTPNQIQTLDVDQPVVAANSIAGKLIYQTTKAGKVRAIIFQNKKGEWTTKAPTQIDFKSLPESLKQNSAPEVEIDFEWQSPNKPYRVRERGAVISTQARHSFTANDVQGMFAHAYYFLQQEVRKSDWSSDLADREPIGHERYYAGYYSGTIRVKLRTETPLLICDDETKQPTAVDGHFLYDMRVDETRNKPLLYASSVRGMLRSSYEAITNSRFGVFLGHDDRLGVRFTTGEGLGLVPCRIDGDLIQMLPGASTISPTSPHGPMYAAWLPYYRNRLNLDGTNDQPEHRQHVCCWIELWERTPWNNGVFRTDQKFRYWKVLSIAPQGKSLVQPRPTTPRTAVSGQNHHTSLPMPLKFVSSGYVCITGFNFDRKHDERVFFDDGLAPPSVPLADSVKSAWENLIRNYRTNQDLVNNRPRPGALSSAVWSRHMTGAADLELNDGSLVYARLDNNHQFAELYPVMIARKLYQKNPRDLLPESLRPAVKINQLSPADRVFGWVSQDSETPNNPAYRSQLRVGVVDCTSDNAVEVFQTPLVLPILAQPKPAQGRFYLGNQQGKRQSNGGSKTDRGYTTNNRLRGPKAYPHHCRFTLGQMRKQRHVASNQNRTISGCVKKDTQFVVDLRILNLSRTELAALVWLLSLPPNHFLRLGLGKPLGFGSVHLEIDSSASCVADGQDWIAKLSDWSTQPDSIELSPLRAEYESKMNAVNPLLLQSFMQIAKGFGEVDVMYPPVPDSPNEIGQHFKWFMMNEKPSAQGLSLPDVSDTDPLLPISP